MGGPTNDIQGFEPRGLRLCRADSKDTFFPAFTRRGNAGRTQRAKDCNMFDGLRLSARQHEQLQRSLRVAGFGFVDPATLGT